MLNETVETTDATATVGRPGTAPFASVFAERSTYHHRFTLPATLRSVPLARQQVIDALRSWDIPTDTEAVFDLQLLVDEVFANACAACGGPVTVVLGLRPQEFQVDVYDGSSQPPVAGQCGEEQDTVFDPAHALDEIKESGRGLLLVENLATAWCWQRTRQGKRVSLRAARS